MSSSMMKEAFRLFDRDADGMISAKDFPTVVRSLGYNPTEQLFSAMLAGKEDSLISYEDFVKMVGSKISSINQEAELVEAFKTFDRDNNGQISTGELKHVLLNLGEKLTAEEIDDLMNVADPQNTGNIAYHLFAKRLTGCSA